MKYAQVMRTISVRGWIWITAISLSLAFWLVLGYAVFVSTKARASTLTVKAYRQTPLVRSVVISPKPLQRPSTGVLDAFEMV